MRIVHGTSTNAKASENSTPLTTVRLNFFKRKKPTVASVTPTEATNSPLSGRNRTFTPPINPAATNQSSECLKFFPLSLSASFVVNNFRSAIVAPMHIAIVKNIVGTSVRIVVESSNGSVKVTKDTDRKPIVLARVRRYLRTGQIGQATCIPGQIVRGENPPARPGPRDRLYYRWYAKEFEGVMRLLRDLTGGRFRDGAVARVLAMNFWTRGEAPTFDAFARAWTKAKAEEHRLLTPEYAYLTDLRHQRASGLATGSIIVGTQRSSRESCDCSAT